MACVCSAANAHCSGSSRQQTTTIETANSNECCSQKQFVRLFQIPCPEHHASLFSHPGHDRGSCYFMNRASQSTTLSIRESVPVPVPASEATRHLLCHVAEIKRVNKFEVASNWKLDLYNRHAHSSPEVDRLVLDSRH